MGGTAKMEMHEMVPASMPEAVRPKVKAARVEGSIVGEELCLCDARWFWI